MTAQKTHQKNPCMDARTSKAARVCRLIDAAIKYAMEASLAEDIDAPLSKQKDFERANQRLCLASRTLDSSGFTDQDWIRLHPTLRELLDATRVYRKAMGAHPLSTERLGVICRAEKRLRQAALTAYRQEWGSTRKLRPHDDTPTSQPARRVTT